MRRKQHVHHRRKAGRLQLWMSLCHMMPAAKAASRGGRTMTAPSSCVMLATLDTTLTACNPHWQVLQQHSTGSVTSARMV